MNVPGDVSIISFGNEPFNKYFSPSISTIQFSGYDLGSTAAQQLIKEIDNYQAGKAPENKTVIKPTRLIIRSSSMNN